MLLPTIPIPVPVLRPTFQPPPTYPLPLPVTPAVEWEGTGDWYRDHDYELGVNLALEAQGLNISASFATLDALESEQSGDLSLTLGCIGKVKTMYLTPYSLEVPSSMDTYGVGMWDYKAGGVATGTWAIYKNPALTDDGSAIYVSKNSQVRGIVDALWKSDANQDPDLVLNAAMYDSTTEYSGLWSDFDPTGLEDALDYLPCFN